MPSPDRPEGDPVDPRVEVVKNVIDASRRYALGHPSGRGLWVRADDLAYDILAALDALPSDRQGEDELPADPRRYIAVVQDPRGYPPPGALDPAPPEGPTRPVIHSVVLADDYDALRRWALAASPEHPEGER